MKGGRGGNERGKKRKALATDGTVAGMFLSVLEPHPNRKEGAPCFIGHYFLVHFQKKILLA